MILETIFFRNAKKKMGNALKFLLIVITIEIIFGNTSDAFRIGTISPTHRKFHLSNDITEIN